MNMKPLGVLSLKIATAIGSGLAVGYGFDRLDKWHDAYIKSTLPHSPALGIATGALATVGVCTLMLIVGTITDVENNIPTMLKPKSRSLTL